MNDFDGARGSHGEGDAVPRPVEPEARTVPPDRAGARARTRPGWPPVPLGPRGGANGGRNAALPAVVAALAAAASLTPEGRPRDRATTGVRHMEPLRGPVRPPEAIQQGRGVAQGASRHLAPPGVAAPGTQPDRPVAMDAGVRVAAAPVAPHRPRITEASLPAWLAPPPMPLPLPVTGPVPLTLATSASAPALAGAGVPEPRSARPGLLVPPPPLPVEAPQPVAPLDVLERTQPTALSEPTAPAPAAQETADLMAERALSPPVMPAAPIAIPSGRPAQADAARAPPRRRRGLLGWLGRTVLILVGLAGLWAAAVVVALFAYRTIDPPFSMLTAFRMLTGQPVDQRWVPIDAMSPRLVLAVITAEDGRFCQHAGVDLREIEAAVERARDNDGTPRGASTITMQLVKNLFLWPSRSYLRKAIEIPLALIMERILDKRRILEIYLNVVEWGPDVFGAEAAARHHFRSSAARLSEGQAALLAVALPNPIERDAGAPGPGTRRVARIIEARMRAAGPARTACVGVVATPAPRPARR